MATHLIVPHASALAPACAEVLSQLALPHLAALLAQAPLAEADDGDEYTLSPPHERALARALGWQAEDGAFPWAARAAAADGLEVGDRAWGLLTPVHWSVGREQVSLADPAALGLDADGSRALFEAVRELFESEGCLLAWGAPLRWYLAHEGLDGLPCASIDRVIGRNVDLWLQTDTARFPAGRLMRRLQNEVQMLLYTHPLSEAREQAGQTPVNSVWLSGCGRARPASPAEPTVDERLRAPLLAEDWVAWAEAWRALDAGPLADLAAAAGRGEPVELTLCGERHARRHAVRPRSAWQKLRDRWRTVAVAPVLEAL
jgi:hypothetical protein